VGQTAHRFVSASNNEAGKRWVLERLSAVGFEKLHLWSFLMVAKRSFAECSRGLCGLLAIAKISMSTPHLNLEYCEIGKRL
jgi:hypothetical protein